MKHLSLSFSLFIIFIFISSFITINESRFLPQLKHNEVSSENFKFTFAGQRFLTQFFKQTLKILNVRKVIRDLTQGRESSGSCMTCKFGVAMLQHLMEYGKGKEEIAVIANSLCESLNLETVRVCKGIIRDFKDELVEVASQLTLSPNEICGVLIGDACSPVYNPLFNWTLPLTPIPKPPVIPHRTPKSNSPVIKVLHISDTHIDLRYREDSNAECGEPLCCRASDAPSFVSQEQAAGYWGDYRECDLPMRTFEEMLAHVNRTHKDIDYVIWTGDIPPHDVWNQTRQGQVEIIREVAKVVSKYLGRIPIYPALGNHEGAPVNSFPTPQISGKYSISWLYDTLEDVWSEWLPQETLANIKKAAYYSVRAKPGLKLISLNMNYCNTQNWWLLLNATDPAGELNWLLNELQASELIGEKVHIIGHIPPGSNDCLQVWSRNYYRIVNRFESTITAQFFGHTHQDEFELFYNTEADPNSIDFMRPTNIAYICPSVTTFGNVNPGYRIYTIDGTYRGSTFSVVDHETHFLNLTLANMNRDPKLLQFDKSYSVKQEFQMSDLNPIEWHNLVMRMEKDDALFQRFYNLFFNRSDHIARKVCSDGASCAYNILCRLVTARSHDSTFCQRFLTKP